MRQTYSLRRLSSQLRVEQARATQLAAKAERLGFRRTVAPGLRRQAESLGVFRLIVDAVADAQRDPRGAKRSAV